MPRGRARAWASCSSARRCSTAAPATRTRWRWTCTTSTSTWRRPASGASRRRPTWSRRSPRRSRQFVEEGGQPARLARYADNCRDAGRRHGARSASSRSCEPDDPGADHRHLPRAGRSGATTSRRFYDAVQGARLHPLPGQADAGRDLPRRLHRRDRAQRDAAGGRTRWPTRCASMGIASGTPAAPTASANGDRMHGNDDTDTTSIPRSPPCARAAAGKVKVAVSDIDGILRGKYLHIDKFLGAASRTGGGFGFCDVVFGWDIERPDLRQHARSPAGSTAFPTRWRGSTSTPHAQRAVGRQRAVLPRRVRQRRRQRRRRSARARRLKRVLTRAEKLGFAAMCGMEFEWFNFAETPQTLGREEGRRPGADHARHVRLLAAAHEPQPRVLQRADGRDARLRRADRGPAHRDRARASTRRRSCSARRSSRPTARSCSRPAPRRSARASASCRASWRSGAQQYPGCSGPHPPEPVGRQDATCSTTRSAAHR